jgi:hypothetical protein
MCRKERETTRKGGNVNWRGVMKRMKERVETLTGGESQIIARKGQG